VGESELTHESELKPYAKSRLNFRRVPYQNTSPFFTNSSQLYFVESTYNNISSTMARLHNPPKNTLHQNLPSTDKVELALQWLRANPSQSPTAAARIYHIENEKSLQQKWRREKEKNQRIEPMQRGGQNKILRPDQHAAIIRYSADYAINGGKGATKQMMYNCAMWLRVQEGRSIPSYRWFQTWLKNTTELYTIKTKPIASHRVNIHTESELRRWFEKEYKPALKVTRITKARYIHNIDEKGARIACPSSQDIIVLIGVKEMYVGIPKNRISLTIIECISANGKAIPPVIIVPGVMIIGSWFHKSMVGHEVITISPTGYTNEGIYMVWLDHFIKHHNCGPNNYWRILLIDGATCHNARDFIIKAKIYKIWIVKYPSHQTHLL
jgi:hypothetical protein